MSTPNPNTGKLGFATRSNANGSSSSFSAIITNIIIEANATTNIAIPLSPLASYRLVMKSICKIPPNTTLGLQVSPFFFRAIIILTQLTSAWSCIELL
jgi:hypothetical protein